MSQTKLDQKTINDIVSAVLTDEANSLLAAKDRVSDSIRKTAEVIINHSGKVVICGLGKSGLIGQKIVATLCSTGTQAVFLHAAEALHGDLGIYHPGDPTILISKSGGTEELLRLIPILKEFRSPLIGIIGNIKSPLSRNVDIVIDSSVSKEADPLGVVPTSSTTLTLALGDALTAVLMNEREFKHEDFVRYHPGGELGKSLRLEIKDILQPLKNVAVVNKHHTFGEVVTLMTEKPHGAALVLSENNELMGIITDGDIRRSLATTKDLNTLEVKDLMSRDPVSIPVQAPIQDALTLMEDRKSQITVLPITEKDGKTCTGLLRLHDIYQTRLF